MEWKLEISSSMDDDGAPLTPSNVLATVSDNTMDFDLMDDLFDDGCWLETTPFNFWEQGSPIASDFSSYYFPTIDANDISHLETNLHQKDFQEEKERSNCKDNVRLLCDASASSAQSESSLVEGNEMNTYFWIPPGVDPNPTTSVKNRLIQAFEYLKHNTRDDFLIQIWVPVKKEGHNVLSTDNQPFSLDPKSKSLECYRNVSSNYQFAAEEDSKEFLGLPGRVFTKKWPEWTPDVRLYSREDYARIDYAQQYNVRGSLALPVFERGSGACLGVVEIVTTALEVDYRPEVEDVCKALEAVDLRSSEILTPHRVKDRAELYQDELAEIETGGFLPDEEVETETLLPARENTPSGGELVEENKTKSASSSSSEEAAQDELSWISQWMEAQQEGKGISVSLGIQKQEPEDFKMKTDWIITDGRYFTSGVGPSLHQDIVQDASRGTAKNGVELSSLKGQRSSGAKKAGEHKRMKTERTISLQVLRQYFAGSLKDAAASIGVCPTTLKRICRQHGISRWPSRKIKKVGHSLKKLQLVIDSVQGSEGAIQLSSFYKNFPELSPPNVTGTISLSTPKINNHLKQQQTQHQESVLGPETTASKSTSSCSTHSSSSSYCCSTEEKEVNVNANVSGTGEASPSVGVLKRSLSDAKLHDSIQEDAKVLVRSHSHKLYSELPPLGSLIPLQKGNNKHALRNGKTFRVKATFGERKIRFSMSQHWDFTDLQREISRRFNIDIEDVKNLDLRYLDEDSEWILLTCNDDLQECIDIHGSSKTRTIKLSLRQLRYPNLGSSLDSCGTS